MVNHESDSDTTDDYEEVRSTFCYEKTILHAERFNHSNRDTALFINSVIESLRSSGIIIDDSFIVSEKRVRSMRKKYGQKLVEAHK